MSEPLTARLLLRHVKPLKLPERLLDEPQDTAIFADQEMRDALSRRAETLAGRLLPLESLDGDSDFSAKRIVLCSLNGLGQIRTILAETRPDLAVRSLTGDFLMAAAASIDPWLDLAGAENKPLPDRRYAVACLPRSGSTFFCHLLRGLGTAAQPTEHLRPHILFLAEHGRQLGFDAVRWAKLVARTQGSPDLFGSKVINEFAASLWSDLDTAQRGELKALMHGARVIHLERTDKIAQSVSQFIADETRVWHVRRRGDEGDYHEAKQAVHYDGERLQTIHARFVKEEADLRQWLLQHGGPVHYLTYEALADDPARAISEAVAFIHDAPPEPVQISHEKYFPMSDDINRAFAEKLAADLEPERKP